MAVIVREKRGGELRGRLTFPPMPADMISAKTLTFPFSVLNRYDGYVLILMSIITIIELAAALNECGLLQ